VEIDHGQMGPAEPSNSVCRAGEQCLQRPGLHRRRLRQLVGWL